MLKDGLYGQVINNKLDTELAECEDKHSTTGTESCSSDAFYDFFEKHKGK